jgi:putative sterol carrier protein
MAKWLTQDWFDLHLELAKSQTYLPGVTAKVQTVITAAPEGDVTYYYVVDNGNLVENHTGWLDDAEVTFRTSYEDALSMQYGQLDPNIAFAQGKVTADGDPAKLEALQFAAASAEFKQFGQAVLTKTEF